MTKEELDLVSWLVRDCARRLKAGKVERYSEAKTVANRKNAEIARALKRGDEAEADRLRWLYYPETMRKRQMAAAVERAPKP